MVGDHIDRFEEGDLVLLGGKFSARMAFATKASL